LSAALELAWSRGAVITPQAVWSDDPASDLVKLATDADIGWILLGPHRAVFGSDYRGGVVHAILEQARTLPLNVAVAIEGSAAQLDHIAVVTDSSADGQSAFELAARLVKGLESTLRVVRIAGADERAELQSRQRLAAIAQFAGPRLRSETLAEPTLAAIIEHTEPGLVIIGAAMAERVGLARRGFPDRRPMILVQGSRFAAEVIGQTAQSAAL
jgi:hypothetical protein